MHKSVAKSSRISIVFFRVRFHIYIFESPSNSLAHKWRISFFISLGPNLPPFLHSAQLALLLPLLALAHFFSPSFQPTRAPGPRLWPTREAAPPARGPAARSPISLCWPSSQASPPRESSRLAHPARVPAHLARPHLNPREQELPTTTPPPPRVGRTARACPLPLDVRADALHVSQRGHGRLATAVHVPKP